MVLLFPIDRSVRPAQGAHESRADAGGLPAVRGLHLDAGDSLPKGGETLRLVKRDEDIGIVVLVHAGGNNARDLESLHAWREAAGYGIHFPATSGEKVDAVARPLVEPPRKQLAQHDTATPPVGAGKAKITGDCVRANRRHFGNPTSLRLQTYDVDAASVVMPCGH